MRLSGLVFAVLLVVSASLLAQHPSAGGASSGGSHSSSGASASSGSSHFSSSGSSRVSVSAPSSAKAGSNSQARAPERTSTSVAEKKSHFSFWRHKEPKPTNTAVAAAFVPIGCKNGHSCWCPGGGTRNGFGKCVVPVNSCSTGLGWNACGALYPLNDCRALAEQLAWLRQQMQGQYDPGLSMRYRMLQDQYARCRLSPNRAALGDISWLPFWDY